MGATIGTMPARRLIALIAVAFLFTLTGCGETPQQQIIGKWKMADPGGKLLSGRIEFYPSGSVIVRENWRGADGPRFKLMTGTYRFVGDRSLRMVLGEAGGRKVERIIGVAIRKNRMSLGYHGGSVVYLRE